MKNKFAFIGRMFSVFDRKRKIQLGLLLIAITISAMLELMGVTIILPFINIIISPEVIYTSHFISTVYNLLGFQSTNGFLVFIALGIMGVYVLKNVYLIVLNNLQFKFSFNNQRRIAHRIDEIYMSQDYLFHTKHNRSELIRDINSDTSMFFRVVLCTLQVITDVCVCMVLLVFLFITDKSITIGIGFIMSLFIVFYIDVFKNKIKYYGNITRQKQADTSKCLLQGLGGIKEIKILNKEKYFTDLFDHSYKEYADNMRKNNVLALVPKPVVETLCICGLMLVIAIKLLRGVDMQYFVPTLTAFAVAAFRILPSFNKITANLNSIIFGKPSVDAVYNTMQNIATMQENEMSEKPQEIYEYNHAIEINDLTFRYPGTERNVLEHVSFSIPKNKSIAFIGPSGAGKTTLADIILGIMKPTEGHVYVDQKDIYADEKSWQKKLGYIPQTIFLLDDTLKHNIALGIPDDEIDDDKIWNAIESAQLGEHVKVMEQGIDTVIGENGVRLSGGQRQRIGIARALYRNPEILVLDEATSALDNDTEAAVMDAINHLQGSKTLIIIAHRLSTIEQCDIVYEIKNGAVTVKTEKE